MKNLLTQINIPPAPPRGINIQESDVNPDTGGGITNPIIGNLSNLSGLEFFQKLLPAIIGFGFVVGTIVFFFVMIIGAIQWITSGGDKAALDAAKGKITNAVIGLVVLFSVIAIMRLIENFFDINILSIDIGPLYIE